jgi:hypothetical protein
MDLKALKDTPPWDWPEDTAEQLLAVLADEDASEPDLLLAADMAGDLIVMNDEVAEALVGLLSCEGCAPALRAQAAHSLRPILQHAELEGAEDPDGMPISQATFRGLQAALGQLYTDQFVPGEVRRGILEASVHAPERWHRDAILRAYREDDEAWKLSAVFCMGFVHGFDAEILQALDHENENIHREAVVAAGTWRIEAAWAHIAALVASPETPKELRLTAIEAAAYIDQREARELLADIADSDDEDIANLVRGQLSMLPGMSSPEEDDFDEEDEFDEEEELDDEAAPVLH